MSTRDGCDCPAWFGVPESQLLMCAHFGENYVALLVEGGDYYVQWNDMGVEDMTARHPLTTGIRNIDYSGADYALAEGAFHEAEARLLAVAS